MIDILNQYFKEQIERSISKTRILFYYVETYTSNPDVASIRVEMCYMTNTTISGISQELIYNRTIGVIPVFRKEKNENTR